MGKNIRIYLFFLIIVFMSSCDKEKSDTTILGSDTSFNFKNVMGKGKLTTRKGEVRAQFYKQLEGVKKFSDIQNIIVRGKLNIGVYDNNCAPFIMKNANGKLYGLDIDIAQSIAESIGVKPNFVYLGSRGEVFKKLCNGEFDIVIGQISSCFSRSEHMFFSSTYAHLKQALIVCKKDLIALDIEKIPYKYMRDHKCRIGAIDDWAYVEFAQDLFPKAEIIAYPKI